MEILTFQTLDVSEPLIYLGLWRSVQLYKGENSPEFFCFVRFVRLQVRIWLFFPGVSRVSWGGDAVHIPRCFESRVFTKTLHLMVGPWMHLQNSLPPEGLKPGRFGAGSRVPLSSFHISTKYSCYGRSCRMKLQ